MAKRMKSKNNKTKIELIISCILVFAGVSLFSWGISELKSPTPWGVNAQNVINQGNILGYWLLCTWFSFLLCIPFIQTMWNLVHKKTKNTLTITYVVPNSIKNNRCTVYGVLNNNKEEKLYLLLNEVNNGAVFVADLKTLKIKVCKIATTLTTEEMREVSAFAPKRLTLALSRSIKN